MKDEDRFGWGKTNAQKMYLAKSLSLLKVRNLKLINRAKSETIAAIGIRLKGLHQDTLFELNKRFASPLPKILNEELLEEAIKLAESRGDISISLLQRTFRIGYSRTAELIDKMEEDNT